MDCQHDVCSHQGKANDTTSTAAAVTSKHRQIELPNRQTSQKKRNEILPEKKISSALSLLVEIRGERYGARRNKEPED